MFSIDATEILPRSSAMWRAFCIICATRSAKILILNKGIIEKISYERRAYESVDEKSLS